MATSGIPDSSRSAGTHLLGLLGEGVSWPHHHAGTGIRVLRQVNTGHPLPRREEGALGARSPELPTLPRGSVAAPAPIPRESAVTPARQCSPRRGSLHHHPQPGAHPILGFEVPHALRPQCPSAPVHQHPARSSHACSLAACPSRDVARRAACACGWSPARGGRRQGLLPLLGAVPMAGGGTKCRCEVRLRTRCSWGFPGVFGAWA